MSYLRIAGLSKTYEGAVRALKDVSLAVEEREFFTIVGPTNAGKSTLLKIIAGVERADAGQIVLAGRDVTHCAPRDRRVSLLFQNIALFPDRNGFDNIAFPLQVAKVPSAEIEQKVRAVARLLKVDHLLDRTPRTFSGGEQQRVAIGRAIVLPSDLLMLDEPLTNLDARIRIALRLEFQKLHRETGQTILYVTHDQIEAMSMSDRIGVLNEGRFEQIGTPDEIYHAPASLFVARFIGMPPMNILECTLTEEDGKLVARGDGFTASIAGFRGQLPARAAIGVRPEALAASMEPTEQTPHSGNVVWIERLGAYQVLDVRLGSQLIKVRTRADHPVSGEGPVWCGFTVRPEHVLDTDTGLFVHSAKNGLNDATFKREKEPCA